VAFHAGVQDILLIAFALAMAEFAGGSAAPIGVDVEGHGRAEELNPAGEQVDLSRTVGWFTTKYPVSLAFDGLAGLSWAQVTAGGAALGKAVKDAKEQLLALADGLTYGLLRYLNPDVDLGGADPVIGFNYLGRQGAQRADLKNLKNIAAASDELWRLSPASMAVAGTAAAVPMPLAHTVELNAGAIDTDAGPQLHAAWTWAPSALDHAQVSRLSQLWCDALAGMCTHVQGGGGGLTPSDVAASLSQQQIDELQRRYADR
jgi:non-ribosomal peptide synthase protein (TIGR01720 family)